MPRIVLTPEQTNVIAQSREAVEAIDEQGRVLAHVYPLSAADLAAVEEYKRNRALKQPKYPAEEVEARLRKLDDIRQREGMDEAKMHDLLRRMRTGEA